MEKQYRFGIIGSGMISNIHAIAIQSLPQGELAGVTDYSPERAVAFAGKYGIRAYESVEQMLADENIDIVCICTPSGFHAEQTLAALKAGKHVVLEKPMALTTESAAELVKACEVYGRMVTVISQFRFTPALEYTKQLLEEGAFGRVVMCSLYMKYWRDPEYYSASPWKGTKRFDGGGALMNQGIHGVDLLQYLMGDAKVLQGRAKTLVHDVEVEDTAAALLEFESGALGVIEATTSCYPGFDRRLEIRGDRGYLTLQEDTILELMIHGKQVELPKRENSVVSTAADPSKLDYRMHARQLQNLLDAIDGKAALLIDAREGYRAVRLVEDVYRSSQQLDGKE